VNLETLGKERLEEISKSRSDWNVFSIQDCKSVIGAHPLTLFVGTFKNINGNGIFCFENN
jgi:hypothetical protein